MRRFRHLPHLTRLGAFVASALLVTAAVSVRSARAQIREGMSSLARQLMPYAEAGVMEAPRRVHINGETLYLSMGTTRDNVSTVLDWYEARCNASAGQMTDSLRRELQRAPALDAAAFNEMWRRDGRTGRSLETLREGDADGGYVACIDVGNARLTPAEVLRRARAVMNTGDLSQWGNFRYAYVSRGTTGTKILTVSSDGRFNLLRMFPNQGDAPGADIPTLARYPGMRRILSGDEEGYPNKLGIHTVRAPIADVRAFYQRTMPTRGWSVMEYPRNRPLPPEVAERRDRMAAFSRGDDILFLVFDQSGGVTSMMSLLSR